MRSSAWHLLDPQVHFTSSFGNPWGTAFQVGLRRRDNPF